MFQRAFICNLLGLSDHTIFYDNLKAKLGEKVGSMERVEAIESLGLLEDDVIVRLDTPLDTLCNYLSKRLALGE